MTAPAPRRNARDPWNEIPVGQLCDTDLERLGSRLVSRDQGEIEIQYASIVLHVGEVVWRLEGRRAWRTVLGPDDGIEIQPGETVSIVTDERVRLPGCASGRIFPKGRMPLLVLLCTSTTIDPGFDGHLYVTVINLGATGVRLPRGLAIAKVELERLPHSARRQYGRHEDARTSLPRDDYLFIDAYRPRAPLTMDTVIREVADLRLRTTRLEDAIARKTRQLRIAVTTLLLFALLVGTAVLPHPLARWIHTMTAGQSDDLFKGVGVGILLTAVLATCRTVYQRKHSVGEWLGSLFGRVPATEERSGSEGETDAGDRQGAGTPG
jgi:dUTPase